METVVCISVIQVQMGVLLYKTPVTITKSNENVTAVFCLSSIDLTILSDTIILHVQMFHNLGLQYFLNYRRLSFKVRPLILMNNEIE